MSVTYRLVLDSVCRSNHHRLAVLALEHLQSEGAEGWRNLFLKHRTEYLEGAKAPDAVFKDFKNHVLHVRDNFWGGAPAAAREWYSRTVRALREEDWAHAAYCAGVMSHYVVDPCQPFHTGQTEEEGVIHRAVEWSFYKAFPEILSIIENDLGWPEVPVAEGDDWLEQMVRAGAVMANAHYETVIDHYDFEVGRSRPVDGLDQELKDIVASLIGYAAVLLSRVLDKAIAEAKAEAPKVGLAMDTISIVASMPVRSMAKRAADIEERTLVSKQYTEYRRTGKVRETMADDDRVVRQLHAEEVLKVPMSTLECAWPRETGTKAWEGAPPRVQPQKKDKKGEASKAAKPVSTPKPVIVKPKAVKPVPVEEVAPLELAAVAPVSAEAPKSAKPKVARKPRTETQKPEPQPVAEAAVEPASESGPRIRLTRDASVVDAPSIGPKTAGRLNVIGVQTVGDLLALSAEEAAAQIKQSHINAQVIKDWQAQALLACSVPELSGTAAQLLVGAGVMSVEDLATSDLDTLVDAIDMFAASNDGERALRNQAKPDRDRVQAWVEAALEICEKRSAA
jgi:predicted flap endonuclease-1-like 5' DNA nuclease